MISTGFNLHDIKACLGTSSGESLLKSADCVSALIPKGSVLFVPWGWYALPIFNSTLGKDKEKDPWLFALHVPVCQSELVRELDVQVCNACNQMNSSHLTSMNTSAKPGQMWVERQQGWTDFWKTVTEA